MLRHAKFLHCDKSSPFVLFSGKVNKAVRRTYHIFCQFKRLLAPAPFAILQKIHYTDAGRLYSIQGGTGFIECASETPDNKYGGISKQGLEKTDKMY